MRTVKTFYRVSEAADYLAISRSKLYMLMESRALPYVKIGKSRRISHDALVRLVERSTIGHDGATGEVGS